MRSTCQIVKSIYGKRLVLKDVHKYVHHFYAKYENTRTKESYYLKTVELPAHLRISEAIVEVATEKYQNLLVPVKIIPIEKNFQTHTYLIRAPHNLILLTSYLQIIRDCEELITFELFKKFLLFLLNSYQILEKGGLPLVDISQIGVNQSLQFTLCDPTLYFRNQDENITQKPFGLWMKQQLREFFNLPLNCQEEEEILKRALGNIFPVISPMINYLLKGEATFQQTLQKLQAVFSRLSEDATTVTASYMDLNEFFERGSKSSMAKNRFSFKKINKTAKTFIIFFIITLLFALGFFFVNFLNRTIICQQGSYLSSTNKCLGCFEGCLRCKDAAPGKCNKCSVSMYLVVDQQDDQYGFCLKQCKGKVLHNGVCIRQPSDDIILEKVQEKKEGNVLIE